MFPSVGRSWHNAQNNKNNENDIKHLQSPGHPLGIQLNGFLYTQQMGMLRDKEANLSSPVVQMKKLRFINWPREQCKRRGLDAGSVPGLRALMLHSPTFTMKTGTGVLEKQHMKECQGWRGHFLLEQSKQPSRKQQQVDSSLEDE